MRSDASSLLKKLSQKNFAYREFPDPIADLELWPIFEALLTDLRVADDPISRVQEREVEFREARERNQAAQVDPDQTSGAGTADLTSAFATYGAAEAKPTPKPTPSEKEGPRNDLRGFFKRLEGGE